MTDTDINEYFKSIDESFGFGESEAANTQNDDISTPDKIPWEIVSNYNVRDKQQRPDDDAKVTESVSDNRSLGDFEPRVYPANTIDSPEIPGQGCIPLVSVMSFNPKYYVLMDIQSPIETMKVLLQAETKKDFSDYTFWLYNSQMLDPKESLIDLCVEDKGLVQVNVHILDGLKRIKIDDVVKPTNLVDSDIELNSIEDVQGSGDLSDDTTSESSSNANAAHPLDRDDVPNENIQVFPNWIVDTKFLIVKKSHNIPHDLESWTEHHVKIWLEWAIDKFSLRLQSSHWIMDGKKLCHLSLRDFKSKITMDPDNKFWIHLELLKKSGSVFVPGIPNDGIPPQLWNKSDDKKTRAIGKSFKSTKMKMNGAMNSSGALTTRPLSQSKRARNNGQYQLWKFLFDILTDREHMEIIKWVDDTDGEFELTDPKAVARLWGKSKNKPNMSYDKLARALRYYYNSKIISKVNGKNYRYKFQRLKETFGFTAKQLSDLVNGIRGPKPRRFAESVTW